MNNKNIINCISPIVTFVGLTFNIYRAILSCVIRISIRNKGNEILGVYNDIAIIISTII